MRLAVTTSEHVHIEVIMRNCGYTQAHAVPYQGWINGHLVATDQRWPGRSGDEITIRVERQVVAMPQVQGDEVATLQLPARHAHPLTLHDKLLGHQVPIRLIHLDVSQAFIEGFPSHVTVPDDYIEQDIQSALQEFGFAHHVYNLPATGYACVTPVAWAALDHEWHYIYFPLKFSDQSEIIRHKDDHDRNEHEHMVLLHSLGFERAVILNQRKPRGRFGPHPIPQQ